MKRKLMFFYGIFSYVIFMGVVIYIIGFVTNFLVPKSIDSGTPGKLAPSLLINFGLITLFALQHSIMARRSFKKFWTEIIPKPIERSTYVLFASILLIVMFLFWQPIPEIVWNVSSEPGNTILWILNGCGWLFLLISTRLINEQHLFGVQQVRQHLKGQKITDPKFQTPAFYKVTRHPMMFGFLLAFWITPVMTLGHLIFAASFSIYIFIGIKFEERDLLAYFGSTYEKYRRKVSPLIPGIKFSSSDRSAYEESTES